MSWDDSTHDDQNDHAEGSLPLYAGLGVIGEAGNFALPDGRHNAMRWHEFSKATALTAEPLATYDESDPDDDAEKAADDTAARLSQGASAGA